MDKFGEGDPMKGGTGIVKRHRPFKTRIYGDLPWVLFLSKSAKQIEEDAKKLTIKNKIFFLGYQNNVYKYLHDNIHVIKKKATRLHATDEKK